LGGGGVAGGGRGVGDAWDEGASHHGTEELNLKRSSRVNSTGDLARCCPMDRVRSTHLGWVPIEGSAYSRSGVSGPQIASDHTKYIHHHKR
jgi:hypothetical protein